MSSFASFSKAGFSKVVGRVTGDGPNEVPSELPQRTLVDALACQTGAELLAKVDTLIRMRRRRADYFPADMFADPAWDLLLALARAELQFDRLSTASLCDAAHVPTSTALRWVNHLAEGGWIERCQDRFDSRRRFVVLTPDASRRLRAYLEGLSGEATDHETVATNATQPDESANS